MTDLCIESVLNNTEDDTRTAFDSLYYLDFQMCDLVDDKVLYRCKKRYDNIKIMNYYNEEIIID